MSLLALANHNQDIERLLKKGYALRLDSAHLVVRDIPYLDSQQVLQWGAIVTKLEFIDKVKVQQQDHQIFFAGGHPHGLDGLPIPNLGGGSATLSLAKADVVVQRTFSNKPRDESNNLIAYPDFFAKVESYTRVIAGPAIERHRANPYTFRVDHEEAGQTVFKYQDTLTSRAEIGDLSAKVKDDVISIIGLGGTGAFLLDFFVKSAVKEVRAFDGDIFHVHTAYRSPGKLEEAELGLHKAEVYRQRYENFRSGLVVRSKFIDASCAEDLEGTTLAFVCVDKGSARAEIFDLLISLRIPFVDVGMGLQRVGAGGPLGGMLRATYFPANDAAKIRDMGLAELADLPDDEYRQNVQIGELNAMNACLAIIRYKKLRGFYSDTAPALNMLLELGDLKLFSELLA